MNLGIGWFLDGFGVVCLSLLYLVEFGVFYDTVLWYS